MKFGMYTLYIDRNPIIIKFSRFPDFPPIIPIFNFMGISGPKNRRNRINYGKTGRYVITESLSYVWAKAERKNLFYNYVIEFLVFVRNSPNFGWIWANLITSSPRGCGNWEFFYISRFLTWYTFIVVSFITFSVPSQNLWKGGGGGGGIRPPPPRRDSEPVKAQC